MLKRSFSWRWVAVLCGIAILLVAIAALQYRWNAQIRQATEVRMGADLESAMMNWHLDLYGEFSAICVALQIGPDSGARDTRDDYLRRYDEWIRAASDPDSVENLYTNRDLIKDVYIWETSQGSKHQLLRFDAERGEIEHSAMPLGLQPLLDHLQQNSGSLRAALRAWRSDDEEVRTDVAGLQPAQKLRSTAITGWQFDEGIPAIVHPIFHHTQPSSFQASTPSRVDPVDWVVVVLNLDTVRDRILPGLTQRYFASSAGLEYRVAVVEAGKAPRLLYSSDSGFGVSDVSSSDSVMNIFGPPPESTEGSFWQTVKNSRSVRGEQWRSFSGPVWFPVIEGTRAGGPWLLVLQHRTGPLEATITKVWRSNLIIGGVILLLLAASTVLVVVASQQAQNLASLQMDFVTSVSHELRTPLAAILSAGQNMTDGFVPNLALYGTLITRQSRQLMDLVDQILLFASVRAGKLAYSLHPVQLLAVFDDIRRNLAPVSDQAGFTLEFRPPNPAVWVLGDPKAIARCLQNLIGNAMKYSGQSRWIGVFADECQSNGRGHEVRISVQDRGVGINAEELNQVFKPFYRSPEVVAAQINGTGLGLSVAKHIAESMGGRISVTSEVGGGSTFTLHLPIAEESHLSEDEAVLGAMKSV
jgi:signal transduction histidine kinase